MLHQCLRYSLGGVAHLILLAPAVWHPEQEEAVVTFRGLMCLRWLSPGCYGEWQGRAGSIERLRGKREYRERVSSCAEAQL